MVEASLEEIDSSCTWSHRTKSWKGKLSCEKEKAHRDTHNMPLIYMADSFSMDRILRSDTGSGILVLRGKSYSTIGLKLME